MSSHPSQFVEGYLYANYMEYPTQPRRLIGEHSLAISSSRRMSIPARQEESHVCILHAVMPSQSRACVVPPTLEYEHLHRLYIAKIPSIVRD